jgi:hypothetical protein
MYASMRMHNVWELQMPERRDACFPRLFPTYRPGWSKTDESQNKRTEKGSCEAAMAEETLSDLPDALWRQNSMLLGEEW